MFKRGDQIVYVPGHAQKDVHHPDCEFGFVTRVASDGDLFCRYWSKSNPSELRTKANSECTPAQYVRAYPTVSQQIVNHLLEEM